MKITMNETRKNIIECLKNAESPMTLREIAVAIGVEKIASGTTNPLVNAGVLVNSADKTIECPCCHKKDKLKTYAIGDLSLLENRE